MATTVDQIRTALASAYPVTVILSPEEDRIEKLLQRFAAGIRPDPLPMLTWNCLEGFKEQPGSSDPVSALTWVAEQGPRGFYLFKDVHVLLDGNRGLLRRLRGPARR
ncbi:MAG TPA: hypothetical protein PKL08_03555, partial [Thermoanaerobaculaceae bacterium]|nr:hypothetical protein [Thermoanaerobaculaceae bacterium]